MISVDEAKALLKSVAHGDRTTETISLQDSLGRVLAKDILSPVSLPPFDQSAMDGYAFRYADLTSNGNTFQVAGAVPAGNTDQLSLRPGEAVRIFTGAKVPDDADTVIMQEWTKADGNSVQFDTEKLAAYANVRIAGEQIQEGAIALKAGLALNAGCIGFLGSLGFDTVEVYAKPRVNIVVTGSEFATQMSELKLGKVFESNGVMLQNALNRVGIAAEAEIAVDDKAQMLAQIGAAAAKSDVVLVTGGVSVGEFDFTKPVLEELGFTTLFHKVKQKPGKPLLFMQKGNQFAFGLPGNPRSALVCFYEYVLPFLQMRQGNDLPQLLETRLPLTQAIRRRAGREEFITGNIGPNGVTPVGVGQGSHMLKVFEEINCLIVTPAEAAEVPEGTWMTVQLLP